MPYGLSPTGSGMDSMLLQKMLMSGMPQAGPTAPARSAAHMAAPKPTPFMGGFQAYSQAPDYSTVPAGAHDFLGAAGADENLLRHFFRGSLMGGQGGPLAQTLFNLGQGKIPAAIQQQFDTNLARSQAATTEGFGRVGARFGTDLTDTLARNANEANVNLQASAMDRALQAIGQATGVGTTVSGLQFQRSEGALDRALKAYIAELQMDPMQQLLKLLLGGAGG